MKAKEIIVLAVVGIGSISCMIHTICNFAMQTSKTIIKERRKDDRLKRKEQRKYEKKCMKEQRRRESFIYYPNENRYRI